MFDNNWKHIIWTISSTGIWNIYINNILVCNNQSKIVFPLLSSTNLIYIFGVDKHPSNYGIIGNIDDFRIYSSVLTSNQVQELYNGRVEIYSSNKTNNIYINNNTSYLDNTFLFGTGSINNTIISTSNSLVLPQNTIVKFNYTNDTNLYSGIYDINFNNGGIGIGESPYVRPWGAYFADDWSSTTLLDSSGNGRHAITSGTITKTTASGNGADASITYISGGTAATISWPFKSIPTNFTILSLTRYNSGTNGRILCSRSTGNWLHGHWNGNKGVCHYEGWITTSDYKIDLNNWVCCIGKNNGVNPGNALIDGSAIGIAFAGNGNYNLGVNNGQYGDNSDWALSCVIIYDSFLSDAHMVKLNNFINTYKSTGNLTVLKSSIIRIIDNSYPILKDERQYPPKLYNSITAETTTTEILGKTSYKQTFTLNTTGITYGSGNYILYSSSVFTIGDQNLYRKGDLFNFNTGDVGGHWDSNYSASTGYYTQSNFIKAGYLGDWIIIKLPVSIILSKFRFYHRVSFLSQAPSLWKCYGSTDGITFNEIIEASNDINPLIASNYDTNRMYEKVLLSTFNTFYNYIGFTFNKKITDASQLLFCFAELQLFGRENINIVNINPTAWYKFDDSTNIGLDSSGNGYNLTNTNTVITTSECVKGNFASSFNTTNYLSTTNGINFNGNSFSICYWQYAKGNTNAYTSSFGNNISQVANKSLMVGYGANAASTYFFGFWANDYYSPAYPNDVNNWVFLTYTYNFSSRIRKVYRNGIYIGGDTSASDLSLDGTIISIGRITNVGGYATNGNYDDFRIYNGIELTESQVQDLYKGRVDVHNINNSCNILTTNLSISQSLGSLNNTITSTCNSLILSQNSLVKLNNSNDININNGDYNVNFNNGFITINSNLIITNKSYPILKDSSCNNINPIVWYKFDDSLTNILIDSSGNNNNLTNNGATFDNINYQKGNGSIKFTASSSQFATIPNNFNWNSINTTNGISFSWWSKNNSSTGVWGRIFDFGNKNSTNDGGSRTIMVARYGADNNLRFEITNPPEFNYGYTLAYDYDTSGINYLDGIWRHYVWTISPSGIWNIYINNSKILDNVQKIAIPTMSGTKINYLGKSLYNSDGYYDGNIDDFRIYSSVLTSNQVQELYNGRVDIFQTGNLLGYGSNVSITGTNNTINIANDNSNYRYAFFANSGTFTIDSNLTCDILVVGGGGGGGKAIGSGGGAGGVVYITNYSLNAGTYSIIVGNGGAPMQNTADVSTANGGNSIFRDSNNNDIITALGGAIASSQSTTYAGTPPKSGGSGAGGTRNGITGGSGIQKTNLSISAISRTFGYGNAGGDGTNTAPWPTGGGGGAGSAGGIGSGTVAGNGGIGIQINITGTNTYYAGGGGGGGYNDGTYINTVAGTGGLGGGGNGSLGSATASSGIANTGGGGGGCGGDVNGIGIAGTGGTGIVIIRYIYSSTSITSNSNSLVLANNSIVKFNYTDNSNITNGTYNINFLSGTITIIQNLANINSFIILKDANGNIINPLVWYKFDNNSFYNDSSGNNNNLINVGSGGSLNSNIFIKGNGSASFNSTANYFRNISIINNDVPISFSYWFYANNGTNNTMISYNNNSGNSCIQFDFNNTTLSVYTALNNQWTISPNKVLNINTWYHVVYTLNNNNPVQANLYINGSLVSSGTGNANQTLANYRGYIYLGYAGDYIRGYNGLLDDFRIYNFVLTSNQVQELYNGRVDIYNYIYSSNYSSNILIRGDLNINGNIKYNNITLNNIIGYNAIITGTGNIINTATDNNYFTYAYFGSNGTFNIKNSIYCDILIVGGGGGGGGGFGAGGGAGALIYKKNYLLSSGTYTINIGSGGSGGNTSLGGGILCKGVNGNDTTIINLSGTTIFNAKGGGGGGAWGSDAGNNGGSGGGCTNNNTAGIAVTTNIPQDSDVFGNSGGKETIYTASIISGGGGGGAGSVGLLGSTSGSGNGGNGGIGKIITITGNNIYYAGGGGGCLYKTSTIGTAGIGGLGGGGNGASSVNSAVNGFNGTSNTGGGGGGASGPGGTGGIGGSGGSGLVIIRYNINQNYFNGAINYSNIQNRPYLLDLLTSSNIINVRENNNLNFPLSITSWKNEWFLYIGTSPTNISNSFIFHHLTPFTTNVSVSGGVINTASDNANFKYAIFTNNGTFTIDKSLNCDILVVGGGGSGGRTLGGGGGGGAVIYITNATLSGGTYNIVVGNGGAQATTNTGNKGNNSSFAGIIAEGGGFSVDYGRTVGGGVGGSGGGAGAAESGVAVQSGGSVGTESTLNGFKGTIYGNRGGSGLTRVAQLGGGGGGGAGSIGLDGNPNNNGAGGKGGDGIPINITGTNYYWGAGGGGAQYGSSDGGVNFRGGAGGLGGGGAGSSASGYYGSGGISGFNNGGTPNSQVGGAGGANTGSGGGAGGWVGAVGGAGGSGIVIIRYSIAGVNSKWWFNGTTTSTNSEISDERIKKNIIDIPNGLDKLMLINPKEYCLCDDKDYHKKYGIVAQDIYQIPELNHLVYKDDDYIANIYSSGSYDNSSGLFIINSLKNINGLIDINNEIKILLNNNKDIHQEIIIEELPYQNRYKKRFVKVKRIIDDYSFEIFDDIELTNIDKTNLFIYGKKINDFHKLDYNSLYTLNIKANQEIYDIIKNNYNTLDNLTTRIKNLENKLL